MDKPPFDCKYEKDCGRMGVSIPEECITYCQAYEDSLKKHGLKDHEIAQLVGEVTQAFYDYYGMVGDRPPQCYRSIISRAVNDYLIRSGLKIDKI